MSSRRLLKAAEAIREVVSMAILTEIRDPRVRQVTVTQVEVAPDMRSAKVQVSIMGDEREEQLALAGLQHSAGFLQHKIADRIDTRYTPRLQFVLDKGVKNALAIASILKQVLPSGGARSGPDEAESSPAEALEDEALEVAAVEVEASAAAAMEAASAAGEAGSPSPALVPPAH